MELLVMLTIGGRKCALRAIDVRSIMEIDAITKIPHTPDHVLGLSTKRSQTLTVIDCMQAAGIEAQTDPIGRRAAIVEIDGHPFALFVDSIEDVEESIAAIKPVNNIYGKSWNALGEGVVETRQGPALLLNPAALVNAPGHSPIAA